MRRWALALSMAGAALGMSAAPAGAWSSFCEDDPPVQVVTPAGHNVTINNFVLYHVQDRHLMRHVQFYATAYPAGPGHTFVVIHMVTPKGGMGAVRVTSRTQRFQQETVASGGWGEETRLYMILDTD